MSVAVAGPRGAVAQANEPLLDRGLEIAAIQAAVERAASRRGTVLIVEAAPGLGKTRLLQTAGDLGRGAALLVSEASGLEFERDAPFGVALRLLAPLAVRVDGDPTLWSGPAGYAAPILSGSGRSRRMPSDAGLLVQGLFAFLRNFAASGDRPLLLAVDDAHWSDRISLRLLTQLASHLGDLPIVLILSMRPWERDTPGELAALRSHSISRVLRLGPLSTASVERLVRTAFPGADESFVAACGRATGGNAFLLHELLRHLLEGNAAADARTAARIDKLVPDSVQQAVWTRIGRLPAQVAAVAISLAVLGNQTPLHLVAAHAGLESEAAEEAVEALISADVVAPDEPLRFRHPLIGAAVEAGMGHFARSRVHRRAAELLRASGAPPERIAPHLLSVIPSGDRDTVALLREAAMRASRRGETSIAAQLLTRAMDEPPPAEWRTDLLVDLTLAGAAPSSPDAVRELQDALQTLPAGATRRARTSRALVKLLFARGDYAGAAAAAETALESVTVDEPGGEELLVDYMAVATFHPAAADRLRTWLEPLLAAARAGEVPASPALCGRLATRAGIAGDRALVKLLAGRAFRAESLADDSTHGLAFAFAAASLTYVDELEFAEAGLTRALERARRVGSVAAQGFAAQCRALVRVPQGKLVAAVADLEEALALHTDGAGFFPGWCVPVLAHARIEQGDLGAAAEVLASHPVDQPATMEDAFVLDIQARLALEQGDPATALARLKSAGLFLAEHFGIDHPGVLAWRPRAAIAASRAGLQEEALELAQVALDQGLGTGIPRLEGVALAAAGSVRKGDAGIAMLASAVEHLERSPAGLERCHALVTLGAMLRRSGRLTDAREPLRRALALADSFGARLLARFALDELRATGARPRRTALSGAASLTPSEQRIAELAASGLSNAEIAAQLLLTHKTVEWHLGHVYSKLGIRTRLELAPALAVAPAHR